MRFLEREEAGGGVEVLRLARPPVNALWTDILEELEAALAGAAERGAQAIVLTGAGACFSAGIDVKSAARATDDERLAGVAAINRLVSALFALPLPVVAAVNGHALGGGLVLPLACDVVIATREPCKLGLNEVAAGVPFPAAALEAVRARLSPPVFNNLCLTGRTFGPQEGHELGVVDELSDAASLLERATALAGELAGFPIYARIKHQVRARQRAEMARLVETDPMLERDLE